jgi:hypothetical protein
MGSDNLFRKRKAKSEKDLARKKVSRSSGVFIDGKHIAPNIKRNDMLEP